MTIFSKVYKPDNVKSQKSSKLSFTHFWGLHSNYVGCETFLDSSSLDILALHYTNLDDSIDSINICEKLSSFNSKGLLLKCMVSHYIWRTELLLQKAWKPPMILVYVFHWLYFIQHFTSFSSIDLSSSLCTGFNVISSNIEEVLSINSAAGLIVFGDFNIDHKTWCPHTFAPPPPHLWAFPPTWPTPSPTVVQSISQPQEIPVHGFWKGQNCQVADKCIDATFIINIL